MTIYEWADRLTVDDRASKSREDFMAICPCHSDTHASLHVYVGADTGQTVMKCHVCEATGKDVCAALGIDMKELLCDALSGEPSRSLPRRSGKAKAARERKTCRGPYQTGDEWGGFRVTNVYEYQTRDGRVVLRKARREQYDESGARTRKSFAMQSLGTDGKTWYADAGIYINLLYHLPDVLSAAQSGGTVILAEGEKDVDNLRTLGYNATCGLCGGGTGKLEGKWTEDHSKALEGAERVVVIPDNDGAGEGLAQWICKHLCGRVGELKLLRIADHYPDLPEHGDFTDWVVMLKGQGLTRKGELIARMNTMIDEAPVWTDSDVRQFSPEPGGKSGGGDGGGSDETPERYYGLFNYCVKGGVLARVIKDGAQPLCSFLPVPKETIVYDTGGDMHTEYIIGGKTAQGEPLPDAHVIGETELAAMRWPMKYWRHWGNIKPVKNARDMILDAINCAGQQVSKTRTVYGHTGMRVIDGRPCYLHGSGAIGAENVSIELPGTLAYYDLADMGQSPEDSLGAELLLVDMIPARIIYPLLAQAYLAPLYSELERMQEPPSYVVFLIGAPGAGKSTVAGYVQAHFGDFYMRRFPANFTDTAAAAREKAFLAKDALYTVDDYVPGRDNGRSNPADMVANAVVSAVADRAERSGLNADKTMRENRPSRCTCVMTGEDMPRLTESRQMRLYRIDVAAGEIAQDMAELTVLRDCARAGYFRQCMRLYIEGLLERWDGIQGELRRRLDEAEDEARKRITRKEGRLVEATMHLIAGVGLMLDHLTAHGAIDEDLRATMYETACAAIAGNIEDQGRSIDAAKPEAIWLRTLASLVNTRSVTFMERSELTASDAFRAGMIGYKDENFYYLDTDAADEAIRERLRKGGTDLGVSGISIYKALARSGKVCFEANKDGTIKNPKKNIKIRGRTVRLLWLHRWCIDGGKPPEAEDAPFKPIEGKQMPMEFSKPYEGNA